MLLTDYEPQKTLSYSAARTYIAHIWEYPPPTPLPACKSLLRNGWVKASHMEKSSLQHEHKFIIFFYFVNRHNQRFIQVLRFNNIRLIIGIYA